MEALFLSFVVFSACANAAGNNQLAIWVPNPCDTFGKLPSVLRPSFAVNNDLKDLNSITAYNRYTVMYATPASGEVGWAWNTQGETPTLTSPYNSATCSSYYATTPSGVTSQTGPTTTAGATTNDVETRHSTTDQNSQPPSTDAPKQTTTTDQSSQLPASGVEKETTSTTLTVSKPTTPSSERPSSVTSDMSNGQTKNAQISTTDIITATTTLITTTKATALPATTVSVGPVPSNIQPAECFATPPDGQRFYIRPGYIGQAAEKFCTILRKSGRVLDPEASLSSGDKLWIDNEHHVTFLLKIGNEHDYPVVAVPDDDVSFNDCITNFVFAWKRCWWTGGYGGTLKYSQFAWTFQPSKI